MPERVLLDVHPRESQSRVRERLPQGQRRHAEDEAHGKGGQAPMPDTQ